MMGKAAKSGTAEPAAPVRGKARSAPKTTPAAAAAGAAAEAAAVAAVPAEAAAERRRKDLVDRVVARSGVKRKDAKPVVEATLAVLGEALAAGERLNLPPFGKMRVNRTRVTDTADKLTLRLSRNRPGARPSVAPAAGNEALAPAED